MEFYFTAGLRDHFDLTIKSANVVCKNPREILGSIAGRPGKINWESGDQDLGNYLTYDENILRDYETYCETIKMYCGTI